MRTAGWVQLAVFLVALTGGAHWLGLYMARVLDGQVRWLVWLERWIYKACGIRVDEEMGWRRYALALLVFNASGMALLFAILLLQGRLPWNPQGFGAVAPHTAFNIAASFVSNTNWQSYAGESTLSYFAQCAGLAVQNFLSAAMGIAVAGALARAFRSRGGGRLGNYWTDTVRTTLYILLPLSLVLALGLVSQGVVQNFEPYVSAQGQTLPMGPAASQISIKQLGTNGGGFFNANSAHPFENPTPLSNFLEVLSIVLLPAAMCIAFGEMAGERRHGWVLLAAMLALFIPALLLCWHVEAGESPVLAPLGTAGGNMEGKEVRFGIFNSALWATATTAASNGSVNAMHDSFLPLASMPLLFLMQVGEVVFGGVGSGLYGIVVFAIVGVFLAGLMVGRTPEYLGKKLEAYEMKAASLAILIPPLLVLGGTGVAVLAPQALSGLQDRGPHGFTEILYAFTSMGNNNGSAFAGYGANTPLVNYLGGAILLIARYGCAAAVLGMAGSLAAKRLTPVSAGTLPTNGPLFAALLAGTILLVGALAFLPALALGPVVEHLRMASIR